MLSCTRRFGLTIITLVILILITGVNTTASLSEPTTTLSKAKALETRFSGFNTLTEIQTNAQNVKFTRHIGDPTIIAPEAAEDLLEVISILVDDFVPGPMPGQAMSNYNRLGGDRGALGDVDLIWSPGTMTATIVTGSWGGMWTSLNHPNRECQGFDFSAILPPQINPQYQSQITGLMVRVAM